jgi:hypothetical protein
MTTDFAKLFFDATVAADKAIQAEIAREPENPRAFDCGFAWVTVKPARGPFISWCKKMNETSVGKRDYGRNEYGGGWTFWCPGQFNGQSVRIIEKGAQAFCAVLQQAGLNAHWYSRLD